MVQRRGQGAGLGIRGAAFVLLAGGLGACVAAQGDGGDENAAGSVDGPIQGCTVLPVVAVTASGDDGNVPENAVDGAASTRWSSFGKGSWLRLDLGSQKQVGAVALAFYKGDHRRTRFVVEVSGDGKAFAPVLSTESSGTTAGPESFPLSAASARYVRITVNGNTTNDWASISEVSICGAGAGGDPQDPPPGGVDKFGVKMIFPTKPGGDTWFMDPANLTGDGRVELRGTAHSVSGDVWNGKHDTGMSPPSFRIEVETKSGFSDALSQPNAEHHDLMSQVGYMQNPGDWRNFEMTGYFKINQTTKSTEEITMYGRGGAHRTSPTNAECQGTAYKGSLKFAGGAKFAKEYYHDGGAGYVFPSVQPKFAAFSIVGKWVGMKTVVRNVQDAGGHVAANVRVYLDTDLDQGWRLWYEFTDAGQLPGKTFVVSHCGASNPSEIITWGGPVATFRIDEVPSVDFKWLSVREITP